MPCPVFFWKLPGVVSPLPPWAAHSNAWQPRCKNISGESSEPVCVDRNPKPKIIRFNHDILRLTFHIRFPEGNKDASMEGTWPSTHPGKIHIVNVWLFMSIWGIETPWHTLDLTQVLTWASFTQVLYLSKTDLHTSAATRSNPVPDPQEE